MSSTFRTGVRLVARREFTERIRDKGFLGSLGVMLVLVLLSAGIPLLMNGGEDKYDVAFTSAGVERYVAGPAQALDVDVTVKPTMDATAAEKAVRDGDLDAAVVDGRIVVHRELDDKLGAALQTAWASAERDRRLGAEGIDPAKVNEAATVPPLAKQTLDPDADKRDERKAVAFIGVFLVYFLLILFCSWVASGVVEEKSSRIVEILLSAVPARALLAGKVLGIGLLGLVQMSVMVVVGLVGAQLTGAVSLDGAMLYPALLVLVWFILGYAFYACLYALAAARVSRQEDLQNVLGPATSVMVLSFMLVFVFGLNDPGTVGQVLAYIPPFSAMLQPILTASGDMPLWGNALAAVLAVAAIAGLVSVAGRMYEGAVLKMGSTVSMKDAWKK